MPIITVQRRMAEQGRIRLGHKLTGTSKTGKTYTRPAKLERFRFTSPSQRLIEEVARTYGGDARPWDNDGKAEHEVLSEATAIPVIVVKGGFSQWHEFWTKGGCQHRCDGEKTPTGEYCNPDDPQHRQAIEKPTTRLSVMLAEIETLGVWRMESHGWNAAAELPSMAELAMVVGDLVPATLSLAERSSIVQTEKGPQTSRYVVPVLDLHVTKKRLVELVGGVGGTAALDGGSSAPSGVTAIEAPRPDYAALLADATTPEECRAIWTDAGEAGHLDDTLRAAITQHAEALAKSTAAAQQVAEVEQQAGPPEGERPPWEDDGEPVDAEVVEDGDDDKDAVWQQLLAAGGKLGMGLSHVQKEVKANTGKTVPEATAAELRDVLQMIAGEAVSA